MTARNHRPPRAPAGQAADLTATARTFWGKSYGVIRDQLPASIAETATIKVETDPFLLRAKITIGSPAKNTELEVFTDGSFKLDDATMAEICLLF